MTPVIELEGVTKEFGSQKAVDNISLRVQPGTVLALLGPNGAGKTTTIIAYLLVFMVLSVWMNKRQEAVTA